MKNREEADGYTDEAHPGLWTRGNRVSLSGKTICYDANQFASRFGKHTCLKTGFLVQECFRNQYAIDTRSGLNSSAPPPTHGSHFLLLAPTQFSCSVISTHRPQLAPSANMLFVLRATNGSAAPLSSTVLDGGTPQPPKGVPMASKWVPWPT